MIRRGRVIEPLAELYKVEVRELGGLLGLPRELVWNHPFPGPGLGVRLLCSNGEPDRTDFDHLVPEVKAAVAGYGLEAEVIPIRSVGVKADLRAYEHPVMLSGDVPWPRILEAAGKIFRDVYGINRCVWNLGGGAPRSFKPRPATVTRERLDLLREADHIVMEGLRHHGLYDEIWQCPTVLVPIEIDGRGQELVVVRPVRSERAMTASAACLPNALIAELQLAILALPGVSGLALDATSKPPGTIEWE
jgi:GMP synthase (glutamine-hydrolysing)